MSRYKIYTNKMIFRIFAASAWQQIYDLHSRLAFRQWSLAPDHKFVPPSCKIFEKSFCLCIHALFLSFSLFSACLEAGETSRQEYLKLIEKYPSLVAGRGDASKGGIELLLDKEKMAAVEKKCGRDVGVVWRDKYWIWINDACKFPGGQEGVYGRILWVNALENCSGVIVMPILSNGKIVLNCNFRHATRSWEMELPRGGINPKETPEAAAQRETLEETGMVIDRLEHLGEVATDTGMTGSVAPVFAAHVVGKQTAQQEEGEAIEAIIALSQEEIKEAFAKGFYECKIRGETQRVPFRDTFLSYALLMLEIKQKKAERNSYDLITQEVSPAREARAVVEGKG